MAIMCEFFVKQKDDGDDNVDDHDDDVDEVEDILSPFFQSTIIDEL